MSSWGSFFGAVPGGMQTGQKLYQQDIGGQQQQQQNAQQLWQGHMQNQGQHGLGNYMGGGGNTPDSVSNGGGWHAPMLPGMGGGGGSFPGLPGMGGGGGGFPGLPGMSGGGGFPGLPGAYPVPQFGGGGPFAQLFGNPSHAYMSPSLQGRYGNMSGPGPGFGDSRAARQGSAGNYWDSLFK